MICECGKEVSARGIAAHRRGAEHLRARQKLVDDRDRRIQKVIFQVKHCHRQLIDAPPELIEAGYWDREARRVLDDYLQDRGIDIGAIDTDELDYQFPKGLSDDGLKAAALIAFFFKEKGLLYSGGQCQVFYSPAEWAARGERYGTDSELIVVHDGGSHALAFNSSYQYYELLDGLSDLLADAGLQVSLTAGWYSAVYSLPYVGRP